jgi:alanine racemase
VLRSLSNQGAVELNGRVVQIVGRVTMDFTMVAVDHGCALGDVATLFGGMVSLDEQASRAGTVSYELLTAMGPRVARRYP